MINSPDCIQCGKHWIEIILVDELNQPITGLNYELSQMFGPMTTPRKNSVGGNGTIREEDLNNIPVVLTLDAVALVKQMSSRTLRKQRGKEYSLVKQKASEMNYEYKYTTIGPLCKDRPEIDKKDYQDVLPFYHFPKNAFKGITLLELNRTHIIEVCPFRAWSLLLHHTSDYSLVNGYNLGAMSFLSYEGDSLTDPKSIRHFFEHQCLDLSTLPILYEGKKAFPVVVIDVPFDERYYAPVFMDTEDPNLHGKELAVGSSQLFYVRNNQHLIVAWRGSQEWLDWVSDFTYRPTDCPSHWSKTGRIHKGFLDAYTLAERMYSKDFSDVKAFTKQNDLELFICGHSLGGALSLAHATELHQFNPVLYTYGSPRLYSIPAITELPDVVHYRHINDSDVVPRVPPEANMENYLFNIWGIVGTVAGTVWSVLGLVMQNFTDLDDRYWHHGKLVMFSQLLNVIEWNIEKTPQHSMRARTSLAGEYTAYLVPTIDETSEQKSEEEYTKFMASLNQEQKQRIFPNNQIPAIGRTKLNIAKCITSHFMGNSYMPVLLNQLLHEVNSEKTPLKNSHKSNFISAMTTHSDILQASREQNQFLLALEDAVNNALTISSSRPEGALALARFEEQTIEIQV